MYQIKRINHFEPIGLALAAKTKPFSQHPSNPASHVLVLGNSLALGVGSSDPLFSIAGRIGNDYPDADITNAAVSGARVHDVIAQIAPFQTEHFDLIAIQVGGNDVTHFTNLKKITDDLNQILLRAHIMSPHVVIWSSGSVGFAPMFQAPASWILTLETKRIYNTMARVAVNHGATYVNLYVPWKQDIFKTNSKNYYAADDFHVTDSAYAIWYDKIYLDIRKILGK